LDYLSRLSKNRYYTAGHCTRSQQL